MEIWKIGFTFILIAICLSGCNSGVKDGLSYDDYIQEAQQFESNNENEKAISAYKKALKIKPNDAKTHYDLGRLYYKEEQRTYKDAFSAYQLDVLSNLNKTQNRDQTKELEGFGYKSKYKALALQEYKETINYSPEHWAARYFVATDHMNKKHYSEAIPEYTKVIKFNPNLSIAYSQLGEAYLQIGYCNSAIDNFEKAFKLDSDTETYYLDVGRVYVKANNPEKTNEMINHLKGSKRLYDLTRYQPNGKCSNSEGLPFNNK